VPPVVESFSSPAAAASVVSTFPCSWAYVFWYDTCAGVGPQLYVTGFQKTAGSACGSFAANPHTPATLSCDCYAVSFPVFTGPPPSIPYTYEQHSGTATLVDPPACANDVTDTGNVISPTPGSGAILVGAVYFGAGKVGTVCAERGVVTLPTAC